MEHDAEATLLASRRRALIVATLLVMLLIVAVFGAFVVWLLYEFVVSAAAD